MRQDHAADGDLDQHLSTDAQLNEAEDELKMIKMAVEEGKRASLLKDKEIAELKDKVKAAESMAAKERERATRTLAASRKGAK